MHNLVPNWQKRRSAFNHDWLKNQYIPALAKCLNVMAGKIDDEGFLQSLFFSVLPSWESQEQEIISLLQSFETEMSPRVLLRQHVFSNLHHETTSWLGDLIHELWLTRYPVEQWVSNAVSKVNNARVAYNLIQGYLTSGGDICEVIKSKDFHDRFVEFRRYCQQTAKAIESFPSKVTVT